MANRCRMQLCLAVSTVLLVTGGPVFAKASSAAPIGAPDPLVGGGQILGLIGSLLLVLIAVVVVLWFMRNLQGNTAATGSINIIGSRSLTAKDKLLLVEIGREKLLIASSPGATVLIHVLAADNDITTTVAPAANHAENFPAVLNRLLRRAP